MHSRPIKIRAATILLTLLLTLMQLTPWLPVALSPPPEKGATITCQKDHALCGCSLRRIASATCCCALTALPPCCQKESSPSDREEKAVAAFTSRPCGSSDDPLPTAGSEAYLLPSMRSYAGPVSTTSIQPGANGNQIEHSISPPDPPPEA